MEPRLISRYRAAEDKARTLRESPYITVPRSDSTLGGWFQNWWRKRPRAIQQELRAACLEANACGGLSSWTFCRRWCARC